MTNRQFRTSLLALFICALLLFWMQNYTNVDLLLADWIYDRKENDFPWRSHWFAAIFMHAHMKHLFIGMSVVCISVLAADFAFHIGWLLPERRRKLIGVVLASVTIPTIVAALKQTSIHHCPWDIERYGGHAPYLRLFEQLPAGIQAGHCFPAGHASGALWIPAIAIFWLPERPKVAAGVFTVALLPGLALGWVQQLRGAHFLSHTLWSAWIAALVIIVIARGLEVAESTFLQNNDAFSRS